MPELGGRVRTIRVYLPKGYDGGTTSYPVLYLQDGQQLFAPGPFGDWLIDETLDRVGDEGHTAGLIVVGIDNGDHRWDEYGPWVNREMHAWISESWARAAEGGDGKAYVHFVAETLKPAVDGKYRTIRDRAHTGIGGSSMGALIAVYAGLTRPDVFSRVLGMSTAVWFAEGGGPWLSHNRLLQLIRTTPPPPDVRFYLDVGTHERSRDTDPDVSDDRGRPVSYARAYVEGSEALAEALRHGGAPSGNVRLLIDAGAMHHESAWAKRFESAVLWLYQQEGSR